MQLDSRTPEKSKPISGKEFKSYLTCIGLFSWINFVTQKMDVFKSKPYFDYSENFIKGIYSTDFHLII